MEESSYNFFPFPFSREDVSSKKFKIKFLPPILAQYSRDGNNHSLGKWMKFSTEKREERERWQNRERNGKVYLYGEEF